MNILKFILPFDFRANPCKSPKKTKKIVFFFAPYVFWICSRGLRPPFNFQKNSSSFDFWENPCKTPNKNKKRNFFFFFSPCIFWVYSKGLFAFVPLDLNFTNPKSTIFESSWKTQHLPVNRWEVWVGADFTRREGEADGGYGKKKNIYNLNIKNEIGLEYIKKYIIFHISFQIL